MPTCWEPGLTFMQDNAPIHKAKKVIKWLEDQGIPVMDWPPYSPDLNQIEHCWVHMKRWILDNRPDLKDLGDSQEALDSLATAIQQALQAIGEEKIRACIESMHKRCQAVIKAKGWHTRY